MMLSEMGIALLLVLWILTILSVIAFSFSFMVRTETRATLFFKEGREKQLLAEAGVETAIMETVYRSIYKNRQITLEDTQVIRVDGTEYEGQLGNDSYVYSVTDESGKINLNTLNDISGIILNKLLVNQGVSKETADTIVDSLLDWRDADELQRLHGAESDYYMSLPNPYKSKNADLETVEELLMVKGMTPEILYGSGEKKGIFDFVTIFSNTGTINVNRAPKEVLEALPGMTPEMADQIIALRQTADIKTIEDVRAITGDGFTLLAPYISILESNVCTIESTGYKKGEQRGFTIRTTLSLQGNGKYRTLYYKSPAGMKQSVKKEG